MKTFVADTSAFLEQLGANNNRDWFKAHKKDYDDQIKDPAAFLAEEVAEGLSNLMGRPLTAKVFRQHRDVRFSKDKTPYNVHLHIGFFGPGGNMAPGFFFGIEPGKVIVGGGCMGFEKQALVTYRHRVDGPDGADLDKLLKGLQKKGWRLDDPELKRVPAPYDKEHERGHLLRRKGLAVWMDFDDISAKAWQSPAKTVLKTCKAMKPLMEWLEN